MKKTAVTVRKSASLKGHAGSVYALAPFQPDAGLFFSAGTDGKIVLWDLKDISTAKIIAQVHGAVYALEYCPGLQALVIGQNNEGIHILRANENGGWTPSSLKLPPYPIFDLKQKGESLFVALGNGEVLEIDLAKLQIKQRLKYSTHYARCLAFCEDGGLAVGYSDHFVRLFTPDGQISTECEAHEKSVFGLAFDPQSRLLISSGMDARIKFWSSNNNGLLLEESIVAHMYTVNHVAFSPDGHYFATCSKDKSIKIWDTAERKLLKVIDKARHDGHSASVNKLQWLPYNNVLVSAGDDRQIAVWDLGFSAAPTV
jgi:WD40 repeat protein